MAYYCYILECADGSYYTGWTTNPERRLRQHSDGRGSRYTRTRRPVRMVYTEELPTRQAAMRRELKIKRMPRAKKTLLAEKNER
jgi:putative endonuclease